MPAGKGGVHPEREKLFAEARVLRETARQLGAEAAQLYGLFNKLGHGGEDFSAIIHLLRGQPSEKRS